LKTGGGANLRAVSRLLGHASIVVTDRVYTRDGSGDSEATVKLLPDPRRRAR
jgi:integrase